MLKKAIAIAALIISGAYAMKTDDLHMSHHAKARMANHHNIRTLAELTAGAIRNKKLTPKEFAHALEIRNISSKEINDVLLNGKAKRSKRGYRHTNGNTTVITDAESHRVITAYHNTKPSFKHVVNPQKIEAIRKEAVSFAGTCKKNDPFISFAQSKKIVLQGQRKFEKSRTTKRNNARDLKYEKMHYFDA